MTRSLTSTRYLSCQPGHFWGGQVLSAAIEAMNGAILGSNERVQGFSAFPVRLDRKPRIERGWCRHNAPI